jgi:hypothetical protein
MIVVDRLLSGGIRFVLDKIGRAVDSELNDEGKLREQLVALATELEQGEISEAEYTELEADLLQRIGALRQETRGQGALGGVSGIEIDAAPMREELDDAEVAVAETPPEKRAPRSGGKRAAGRRRRR